MDVGVIYARFVDTADRPCYTPGILKCGEFVRLLGAAVMPATNTWRPTSESVLSNLYFRMHSGPQHTKTNLHLTKLRGHSRALRLYFTLDEVEPLVLSKTDVSH